MSMAEAYQTLGLNYGGSTREDVVKAWKRLQKRWHPDKNDNSRESTEHTQRLNSAKDLIISRLEALDSFRRAMERTQAEMMEFERLQRRQRQQEEERQAQERKRREESKQEEEKLRRQREHQAALAQDLKRREESKQEEEKLRREREHQAALAQDLKRRKELAQKEESRRAKARITRRETNRKEVILVYNGPDLDQKFFRQHLVALKVVRFKGRVVDAEKGTKAVWVVFGRELRRTAIQKAIGKHNLSVDDSSQLKIRLGLEDPSRDLDEVIICSHDRKRLQNHKRFLFITSGKGHDASYWESDCNQ